jgi:hypothetical protein
MGRTDDALVTDSTNLEASRMWEGQLCLAVKDGLLRYLFENKGDLYNGRCFEMLAALSQHCRPVWLQMLLPHVSCYSTACRGTMSQSYNIGLALTASLWSSWTARLLSPLIHSCYSDLLDQFCTRFKSIKTATINLIVDNIVYHDGFTVHERKNAKTPASALRGPAAASANMDQKGTVWQMPFDWLSKSFSKKVIKTAGLMLLQAQTSAPSAAARTSPGMSLPSAHC